jgi:hypothetical protein
MGRPRKSVRATSFTIDTKMLNLVHKLADKRGYTMSHIVNMALQEYQPLTDLDVYRDYWKCDQRDCAELNKPEAEKCKECGQKALWVILKEHTDRIKFLQDRG